MPTIYEVPLEEVRWIDDAIGYDNVTSVGAAYDRLIALRIRVEEGGGLRVLGKDKIELTTVREFDDWVRARYPVFISDPLHPIFGPSR